MSAPASSRIPLLLTLLLSFPGYASARGEGADGEFGRRLSSHFELLQDVDLDQVTGREGSRHFEREVVGVLEEAYDRVDEMLHLSPRGRVPVYVYDPGIFQREFAAHLPFPVAGFYLDAIRVSGATEVNAYLVRVLNHEYVHAAFARTAPNARLPAWVNEGTAEWVAARSLGSFRPSPEQREVLHGASLEGRLFPLEDLSDHNFGRLGPSAGFAYLQSYAMIEFLVDYRGEIAFRKFIARLLRGQRLESALRQHFGLRLDELQPSFAEWLAPSR